MREVGAFEAKNKFGQLLDWVEQGEEVAITRHGKEVARLVYFPRKNGHECVWFFSLVIEAEGYAAVKVASRHKRPPSRAERGPLPFIPFARLTFAPPSAQRVAVTFSFEKVVLFCG